MKKLDFERSGILQGKGYISQKTLGCEQFASKNKIRDINKFEMQIARSWQ